MIINMPPTEHPLRLPKHYNLLPLPLHLVLTPAQPLLPDLPSLLTSNRSFHKQTLLSEANLNPQELHTQSPPQIHKFLSYPLTPTHLHTHHHLHPFPIFHHLLHT
ncbi:ChbG/HpnK family deacetylase, partial [Bacillus cereus]|uniref:ChbG/HpnK family deacetylase n=1 Tax=Bacillus cereus TaxID=1396 RepID=UPI0037BFE079